MSKDNSTPMADAALGAINGHKPATQQQKPGLLPAPTTAQSPAPAQPIQLRPANNPALAEARAKAQNPTSKIIYSHAAFRMPAAGRSFDLNKRRTEKPELVPAKVPGSVDATLAKILQWRRGHDSEGERGFHAYLLSELNRRLEIAYSAEPAKKPPTMRALDEKTKAPAAFIVRIPRPDGKDSTTLFSCHIDTVDRSQGVVSLDKQAICYDSHLGHIFLDPEKGAPRGDCLGSDDGIGIWIMLNMISARTPGSYVFHRGEERGGLGAGVVLRDHLDFLKAHELAIAFDRPDDYEIITHQGSQRCASDKCAEALKAQLATHGLAYSLSTGGTFTDTKVYRGVIDECFNLGVGYYNQHTTQEHVNYGHAMKLMLALCNIDWDSLPIDRDCKTADPTPTYGGSYRPGSYGGWTGHTHGFGGHEELDDELATNNWRAQRDAATPKGNREFKPNATAAKTAPTKEQQLAASRAKSVMGKRVAIDDPTVGLVDMTAEEIVEFVGEWPAAAAILIGELATELAAERARIETYRGLLGLNDV